MPTPTPQPEPSYENVTPLLARAWADGPNFAYLFRCPVTGTEVTGSAAVPQLETQPWGLKSTIMHSPGDNLAQEASTSAEMAANDAVAGSGLLGSFAAEVFLGRRRRKAQQKTSDTGAAAQQEVPRQMLVAAFRSVADSFTWDAAGNRWVSVGA